MSTNQACGEPHWFMKQESDSCFAQLTGTYGDQAGVYTATIDGNAVREGDLVMVNSVDAPLWADPCAPLAAGEGVQFTGNLQYSNDVAIVEDGYTISMKDMHARIGRLERQVEMWKSAAMTLKEINGQLQEAADEDRKDREVADLEPPVRPSPAAVKVNPGELTPEQREPFGALVTAYLREQRALAAYEHAKKFTR